MTPIGQSSVVRVVVGLDSGVGVEVGVGVGDGIGGDDGVTLGVGV
jgi:hypothetical protein